MPSVLETIRVSTRELHLQLESRLDLQHALSSRAHYADLLAGYLGIYRPLERMLRAQPAAVRELSGWPNSWKAHSLEEDLRVLGYSARQLAQVAECEDLPLLEDVDCVLGALYVTEGSSLGGQLIFRQVAEKLQLGNHSGASFFYGEGPETGPSWKRFTHLLQTQVSDAERSAECARMMFSVFEHWLVERKIEEEKLQ